MPSSKTCGLALILVVERFNCTPDGGRRSVVCAHRLGLAELSARYGTNPMLADAIKASFTQPKDTLRELYTRMVFNVCVGNNDDHLRNHAAFWTAPPGSSPRPTTWPRRAGST